MVDRSEKSAMPIEEFVEYRSTSSYIYDCKKGMENKKLMLLNELLCEMMRSPDVSASLSETTELMLAEIAPYVSDAATAAQMQAVAVREEIGTEAPLAPVVTELPEPALAAAPKPTHARDLTEPAQRMVALAMGIDGMLRQPPPPAVSLMPEGAKLLGRLRDVCYPQSAAAVQMGLIELANDLLLWFKRLAKGE